MMKLFKISLFFFCVIQISSASKSTYFKVNSIRKVKNNNYQVGLVGHPGKFFAKKKDSTCLVDSYKNKTFVEISYSKKLFINSCSKKVQK